MSYEVPNEEQQNRKLRKDIAENRDLIRFTPSSTNADAEAIGAGSHDLSTGVITGNIVLNPERHYESIQISWTSGSGTLNIGDVITTTVGLNTWEGKFVFLVGTGNSTAGTGIFEPQWLVEPTTPLGSGTPRSVFPTNATALNEISSTPTWTATYTSNTVSNYNVITQSASIIMDKMESGNPSIKNIFGAKADGQFTTIKPKEGKTLVLKPNGNIDVSQDTNVLSTEIAILQFQEDNTTPNSDGSWTLVSSGGSGGNSIKTPCRVATTGNNLVPTAIGSTVDGVTISVNDRVLYKDQSTQRDNGIYVCTNIALGVATMERASDMPHGSTIEGGLLVYVNEGTVNGDNLFGLTTNGSIDVGTDVQVWANLTAGGSWVGTASSSLNMVTFPIYGQWDIGGGQTNFVNTDPTVGIQADLDMNTYDIKDVCRIGFELGGTAIQNTISGISTTLIPSTTNYSMDFNVPDNSEFKFTTYGRNRFRVTDTETKIYTENGGATYERLTVDNLDVWLHNINLTPTTNSQDLGGSSTNEQWRSVYGNKFRILNHTSNITTTTEGGVFMNATNGLTLKSYDLGSTNFGSTTFTDKDGANRVEFNYDMSATDGNAVFNYMRKGFKIRSNASDGEALLIYPRQNSFATNDVIMDVIDPSANGALSIKLNSFERIRLDMTNTTIKAQTASGQVQVNSKIYMNGSTDAEKEISAGNVVPRSYGYTLGASGTGMLEKGWGSLYLTTEGSNADKGKITLNDHGATYMKFDESTGISLVTDDALSFTSASSVLWNITAGTGMTFVIGGATTHTFHDSGLDLGSGVDLVVNANLLDFTNRATPSSIYNNGAMYSKSVSGVTTPMWWDGTTETSMLGGGSSSGGGVNSSYIWTNDETNEYDKMVYLSNATMGSSSGTNGFVGPLTYNYLYFIPIYFSKACTINEIGFQVTNAGQSFGLRYGLYSNHTDQNYPNSKVAGGTSTAIYLAGGSVGATRAVISGGMSVPSAGLYWVAVQNITNNSSLRIECGDYGCVNTVGHVYNDGITPKKFEAISAYRDSHSSSTMPNTPDDEIQSIGFGDANNRAPIIFLRVS